MTRMVIEITIKNVIFREKIYIFFYGFFSELNPEMNPKWDALSEILSEIHRYDAKSRKENDPTPKVLILAQDYAMCNQIKNFLTLGGKEYLLREAKKKLSKNKIQITKKSDSK